MHATWAVAPKFEEQPPVDENSVEFDNPGEGGCPI